MTQVVNDADASVRRHVSGVVDTEGNSVLNFVSSLCGDPNPTIHHSMLKVNYIKMQHEYFEEMLNKLRKAPGYRDLGIMQKVWGRALLQAS